MQTRYKILLISILWMAISCSKDDIKLYDNADYIQFTKYLTDSMSCSFLASPGNETSMMYPIELEVVGLPSDKDRQYKISVVKEYTNATEKNYLLPENTVIRAGRVIDTCWIKAIKTDEIAKTPVRLSIKLEESDDFKLGQTDKLGAIIYITDVISKPDWWNSTVTNSYLGDYSDKKYRLFIQETGMVDIDVTDIYELRYHTIIFKNYLQKEKDQNRTVYEENGQEMTVKLIG